MNLYRKILLMGFVSVLALAAIMPAYGVTGAVISHSEIRCDGVTVTYSMVVFDRDNSGAGGETYHLQITDGLGTILFNVNNTESIPSSFPAQTESFTFSVLPAANPIRVRLVSIAGNGFSEQVVWDFSGSCPSLPPSSGTSSASGVPAPTMPANFVLVNITCDTPVYNTPAGAPVGEAAVTAGQTWFVSPEPVEGEDGNMWTEIFVSSYINPYIPTACIG